jgi:hypothetical protein
MCAYFTTLVLGTSVDVLLYSFIIWVKNVNSFKANYREIFLKPEVLIVQTPKMHHDGKCS